MSFESLTVELRYCWQPFKLDANHLSFGDHVTARLERGRCSFWGPAVYKWEGLILSGENAGKRGVLIGETGNLRQRIKQYVAGTQERGNKVWRETFLKAGDIYLYVLCLESFTVSGLEPMSAKDVFARNNLRLILEQLLVMQAVAHADSTTWVVNARQ